ncbi:calcium-binding protein [Nocardioides sp. CN2-186]|uniref:calcium-binding protein n=1 Tax=Nocardioides tweenelious TaxID=3156607 RepID=UPI0032B44C35
MRRLLGTVGVITLIGAGLSSAPAYAAAPTCQGRTATIVATADAEDLQGSEDADVIVVGAFNQVHVNGRGGDDVICATAGHQAVLDGGPGDDTLEDQQVDHQVRDDLETVLLGGDTGDDRLIGGPATQISYETSEVGVTIDLAAGTVVHAGGTDTVVGIHQVTGSDQADIFRGSPGDDRYIGEIGNPGGDQVAAGAGNDYVQAAQATVDLGPGDDTGAVFGGTISGGEGDDSLGVSQSGTALGGPGRDRLDAYLDDDYPYEFGPVRLDGGPGNDTLVMPFARAEHRAGGCPGLCARGTLDGGSGSDVLELGEARRAVVDLGAGEARVYSGRSSIAAIENVTGSRHADVIRGDRHANRLEGNDGDDVLVGRSGADRLIGGSGRDRASGGPGRDRCTAELRSSC